MSSLEQSRSFQRDRRRAQDLRIRYSPAGLTSGLLAIGYLSAILAGGITYRIWGQVLDLREQGFEAQNFLQHPRGLRFLLVSPAYFFAERFKLSENYVFSIMVGLLMLAAASLTWNTVRRCLHLNRSDWIRPIIFFLFILIALLMNGRISYAMCGVALLLATLNRWYFERRVSVVVILKCFIGVGLAGVSSGTIFVGIGLVWGWVFCVLALSVFDFLFGRVKLGAALLASILFVATFIYVPAILAQTLFNIGFYGGGFGGFVDMLSHGAGLVFHRFGAYVAGLAVVAALLLGGGLWRALLKDPPLRVPLLALATSGIGGLFGFSTLLTGLPAAIVIACTYLMRFTRGRAFNRAVAGQRVSLPS